MPKKTDHVDDLDDPKYDPPAEEAADQPQPKPGDAGFDWTPLYGTGDLYTHTFADGTVVAIRSFGSIYSKTFLYKLRNAQVDTDIQFAAIDRAACATAQAIIESLEAPIGGADPVDELWDAWSKAGTGHAEGDKGLSLGE